MDLQTLREATRPEHEATEALMPLGGPEVSLETYREVLALLLPLVEGWEAWSQQHAPAALQPLLPSRRRAHLLERDLKVVGEGQAAIPAGTCAGIDWDRVMLEAEQNGEGQVPTTAGPSFLGALYVMEGSTLGGRFLAKHLETTLGLIPGEGDAYFAGHGEKTGSMWREVTAEIAKVPDSEADLVIRAARRTFAAYGQVLAQRFGRLGAHG